MMMKVSPRPRGLANIWVAVIAALALGSTARADSLKIAGSWLDNVTIQSVKNGQMLFTSGAGADVEKSLAEIEGIKMNSAPELEAAQKAADGGDAKAAAASYAKAIAATREPWLKRWAQGQLVQLYDKNNQPAEVVDAFLVLMKDADAEAFYFAQPPTRSLAGATAEQRSEIRKKLTDAKPADKTAVAAVTKMLTVLSEAEAAAPAPGAPATPAAPGGRRSAVVLPKSILDTDPIGELLRQGKFQEALTAANAQLDKPSDKIAILLFERGVAQFNLAEKASGPQRDTLYKDAGLSFMRVVIYFPRNTTLLGPSLMEAGAVHEKIRRHDLAQGLWDRARNFIDADADPELAARLEKLIEGDTAAPAP